MKLSLSSNKRRDYLEVLFKLEKRQVREELGVVIARFQVNLKGRILIPGQQAIRIKGDNFRKM